MERQKVPVSHTSLRSLIISSRLHQNPSTTTQMGSQTGDQDVSLFGRSNNISTIKGAVSSIHTVSTRQAEGTGIHSQRSEIDTHSNADYRTPRIQNQLTRDDHHCTSTQDQRYKARGSKTLTQRSCKFKGTFFIRRKGNGNLSGYISSKVDDPSSFTTQEFSTTHHGLEQSCDINRVSQGELMLLMLTLLILLIPTIFLFFHFFTTHTWGEFFL
jgi:hypothetical protein